MNASVPTAGPEVLSGRRKQTLNREYADEMREVAIPASSAAGYRLGE